MVQLVGNKLLKLDMFPCYDFCPPDNVARNLRRAFNVSDTCEQAFRIFQCIIQIYITK
jgi:hypothetical protein